MAGRQSSPASFKHSGHAHPSPTMEEPSRLQTVRDLFYKLEVDFQLRDILGAGKHQVTDVYCPEIRRSPTTTETSSIKHLDVVYCWKGMDTLKAEEIAYWENSFKCCLENMVADIVVHVFVDYLHQENEQVDEWTFIPTLVQFLSIKNPRILDITVPDLVSDMIMGFYADGACSKYKWFTSSRDLPSMVFNFVRTHDCFIDSYPYPSLEISFSHDIKGFGINSYLCIFGNVNWQLPFIDFKDHPHTLPVGAEYRVACKYIEPVLSESFQQFPAEPEFIVSSDTVPLAWDSNNGCFRAIVPGARQEMQPQSIDNFNDRNTDTMTASRDLKTNFSAKINMKFPGDVRFEMTSRYILNLQVDPRPTPVSRSSSGGDSVHYMPSPVDVALRFRNAVSFHSTPPACEVPKASAFKAGWGASPGSQSPFLPSYSNTPASKRRVVCERGGGPSIDPLLLQSPNTPSAVRDISAQSQSDFAFPKFSGYCTDEVESQVDGLNQNHPPGVHDFLEDAWFAAKAHDIEQKRKGSKQNPACLGEIINDSRRPRNHVDGHTVAQSTGNEQLKHNGSGSKQSSSCLRQPTSPSIPQKRKAVRQDSPAHSTPYLEFDIQSQHVPPNTPNDEILESKRQRLYVDMAEFQGQGLHVPGTSSFDMPRRYGPERRDPWFAERENNRAWNTAWHLPTPHSPKTFHYGEPTPPESVATPSKHSDTKAKRDPASLDLETPSAEEVQSRIRQNYEQFKKEKKRGGLRVVDRDDDDEQAMAKVFLEGSETSGDWDDDNYLSDMMRDSDMHGDPEAPEEM